MRIILCFIVCAGWALFCLFAWSLIDSVLPEYHAAWYAKSNDLPYSEWWHFPADFGNAIFWFSAATFGVLFTAITTAKRLES